MMKIHEIVLRREENGWCVTARGGENLTGVSVCVEIGGENMTCDWHKPYAIDFPVCDSDEVVLITKNLVQQ